MSSIQKLSVRGIRSFSPEDEEQVLQFYMPLTVIVGANGCGKTTIIESLKFAVCGSMPPGNKSGQAFVHDPRSIGSSVVKANIKLRFTNQADATMVVVRSMEVTQKKTTLSFKQLDGVIRTAANGQKKSMSHKCTELDRQVPMMLGVSKAILENVVFCHQEESSWPLQEGAVLKKKFDDIFDSTRYTKALEVFNKLKKEYNLTAKDLKSNVMELKSHKHAAQQFQREAEKYNEQLEELEENLATKRNNLKENEAEKERLTALQNQIYGFEDEIGRRKQDLVAEKTAISAQLEMIARDMTNEKSLQELQHVLQSFDSEFEGHREKKHALEERMKALSDESEKFLREQSELQSKIGKVKAEKETHEKTLKARYEKMVEIGTQFGLGELITQISQASQGSAVAASQDASFISAAYGSLDTSVIGSPNSSLLHSQGRPILNISPEDMNEFKHTLDRKQKDLKEELSNLKAKRNAQEDRFNNEISELKGKFNVLESDKRRLEGEKEEAADELKEIGEKASQVPRMRKEKVDDAKTKAEEAAKKRDTANSNPRKDQIPIEIESFKNKMAAVQQKLDKDKEAQSELMSYQSDAAEINEAIASADSEFDTLQEAIKENVDETQFRLFGLDAAPMVLPKREDDAIGDEVQKLIKKTRDDIQDKLGEREAKAANSNKTVKSHTEKRDKATALLDQDKASAASARGRLAQLQNSVDKINQIVLHVRGFEKNASRESERSLFKPDAENPQALLEYLKDALEEIDSQSTKGVPLVMLRKVTTFFKRKAQKWEKCPCCKKTLDGEEELQVLFKTLDGLLADKCPLGKTDEATATIKANLEQWYDTAKQTQADVSEFFRLKKEADLLEARKSEREKELASFEAQLREASGEAEEFNNGVDTLRGMLDSWNRWVDSALRVAGFRAKIVDRESSIRGLTSDTRDLKTVTEDISKLETEKDDYFEKVDALNKEKAAIIDAMSHNAQKATQLEKYYRDMQEKYDKELKLGERKEVLKTKQKSLKKEIDQLSDKIMEAKKPIEEKEREKSKNQKFMDDQEAEVSETTIKFTSSVQELDRLISTIEEYEASDGGNDISALLEESDVLVKHSEDKKKEHASLKPELEALAKVVDDQEKERSTIEDNIRLLEANERAEKLEKEIAVLNEDLSLVEGSDTVDGDLGRLDERKSELIAGIARLEGRRSEIVESIRGLKRKLSQPEYKNVEEQFRVANIKFDTSEMAVKDIEKYHSALDKALQRYHSIKIGEINNIIRDLWSLTYKGEDINKIEIISGQESGSRASRSYNYRVVMEKGGSRMDMRGRCSAGQRVLASIVIRLALAETFCVQFGCIALDEPTVNLDHNNKKGLAVALAQIIESRHTQSNFQLVLITHDEDFVSMMKNELATSTKVSMPEKYFQIRREEGADGKFYSKIDAVDWEELL